MNTQSTPDNVVNLSGRLALKPGLDISTLVSSVRTRTLKRLPALLAEVLEKADNTLFDFVQKADGTLNHQEYFDAMRDLRKQRPLVERRYAEHITTAFAAFERRNPLRVDLEQGSRTQQSSDAGELSLVSEEDLEEQLSTKMVAVAVSRLLGPALHQINRRLSALIGGVPIDDENSPIGPAHLAYAFRIALQPCEISVRVKVLLFKLYERELPRVLQSFYAETNRALTDAGVLPDVRPSMPMRREGPAPGARVTQLDPNRVADAAGDFEGQGEQQGGGRGYGGRQGSYSGEGGPSEVTEQALFSTIHELLEAYRGTQGTAGGAASAGPAGGPGTVGGPGGIGGTAPLRPLSPNEMLSVLSMYQTELPTAVSDALDDPGQSLSQKLKQELLTGAERIGLDPNTSRMSAADEDAIDLVGMLFEVLLDERDFPNDVRKLISRLIVPFIKVALLDRRMFLQKSHPARRLLNSLAEACEGNAGEAPQDRELLERVQRTVDRLAAEFNEDIAIFEALEQEFREFIDQHRRRVALAERRAAEAQRGKERLDFSRTAATGQLEARLRRHPDLPAAIESFLRRYWCHHLTLVGLREGHDSERFGQAVAAGDALLACWQDAQDGKADVDAGFSTLRPELEPVLVSAGCVGSAAEEVLASMQRALSPALATSIEVHEELAGAVERNAPPENAASVGPPVPDAVGEEEDDPAAALEFEESDVDRVRRLAVGTWVQFLDEEGNSQPAKLSWLSPISNRLLFVNRRGLRYCVASAEELAAMIHAKRLVIRENDAAFEHAMNQVLGRLRANSAASKATDAPES